MMEALTQEGDNTCSSPIKKKRSFTGLDSKQKYLLHDQIKFVPSIVNCSSYCFNLSQRKEGHNKELKDCDVLIVKVLIILPVRIVQSSLYVCI